MTGLDLNQNDRLVDGRSRHPGLYAVAEVALLCVLAVLIFGLFKLA